MIQGFVLMKQRLLFLGPPGAGKGTQAKFVCQNNSLSHLSTGDLLRLERDLGSPLGKEAEAIMNKGELVSDQLVLSIVEKQLNSLNSGWLLDGFPRNVLQAEALEVLLQKISQPLELVVLLDVEDSVLIERLLARGRDDDNEKVIRNRLDIYRRKTLPLINYYSQKELLITVAGNGTVEEIGTRIEKILK